MATKSPESMNETKFDPTKKYNFPFLIFKTEHIS